MVLRATRVCEHSREGEEEGARILCHLVAVGNMTLWIHETGQKDSVHSLFQREVSGH